MIPSSSQIQTLWMKYSFPKQKQIHVEWVARVALFLGQHMQKAMHVSIDFPLLHAASLLHDIDKNIPKQQGEVHPETGVRILKQEGMNEVAQCIKRHSLYSILDTDTSPHTLEEKIVYLADKMCKYACIGVDARFDLWRAEKLSENDRALLEECYPKVKALEKEIGDSIGMTPSEMTNVIQQEYTSVQKP